MVKGFLHAAISVTDIRKALFFYCDTLGFTYLFDILDEQGKPKTFYTRVNESQYFEIFLSKPQFGVQKTTKPDSFPYAYHHMTVYTPSLEVLEQRLAANDIPFTREAGCIWVRDPDGNLLQFTEK